MDEESFEPETNLALAANLEDSFFETRRLREGGWDGPKMATFLGTLADTGVVTFACRACGISAKSAYALRHRDPVFAKGWDAALSITRHRLADELLARSLKGSHEALLRDGAIVAERQHFDNKLAFSMLRRLDRQAELGATFRTPPAWELPVPAPAVSGEWHNLLEAIGEGRSEDAERLLTQHEQGNSQGNDPPFEGVEGNDSLDRDSLDDDDDEPEERERVWHDWQHDEWRTDFPAPKGFDGDEYGRWDDAEGYCRTLTPEEMAALAAAGIIEPLPEPITIEEDTAARDQYFASLGARAQGENCEAIVEQRDESV